MQYASERFKNMIERAMMCDVSLITSFSQDSGIKIATIVTQIHSTKQCNPYQSIMIAMATHQHIKLSRNSKMHSLKRDSYARKKKTMSAKFKKPKKSVRFCSEPDKLQPAKVASMQDLRSRWYSYDELIAFKQESVQFAVYSTARSGSFALPRGMEGCTKERLKHKANTVRCVVVAHKKGKSPDYVAALSQKCSGWNTELAFHQACRDYFELYNPDMLSQLQPVRSKAPKIALVKRTRDSVATTPKRTTVATTTSVAVPAVPPEIVEIQKLHRKRTILRREV
jgi:hypothetical protein